MIKIEDLRPYEFPHIPPASFPTITNITNAFMADTFYERLKHHIEETIKELKDNQQLVVYYNNGGQPIQVTNIGYHNPTLIILYGIDGNSTECNVLVHMNSATLVLKIVEKDKAGKGIGFLA